MNFFNITDEVQAKKERETIILEEFKGKKIKFKIISTSEENIGECAPHLLEIKAIFQKQLPKMPKEYIFRQVFDKKHRTLILMNDLNAIIGGICYRPFLEKNFVEIVFCAVDSESQVKGLGGFMMDFLKEQIKTEMYHFFITNESLLIQKDIISETLGLCTTLNEIKIGTTKEYIDTIYKPLQESVYLMTYADNYAIGYFKKQGFTKEIKFKDWVGYIKDYDGGTLMQCRIIWEINYLRKNEVIEKLKDDLIKRMEDKSQFNILREIKDFDSIKTVYDIPGLKEAKINEGMIIERSKDEYLKDALRYICSDIQSHSSAWPFLEPVNPKDVTDYYLIIKQPMDLSKINSKIEQECYKSFEDFKNDVMLMINNCYIYNAPTTLYYKCAQKLEEFFIKKIETLNFIF